jgi:hypothetical protein
LLLLDPVIIDAVRNVTGTARETVRLGTLLAGPVFDDEVELR